MKKIFAGLLLLAALFATLDGCKNKYAEPPGLSIGQLVENDSSLSILQKAIKKAGMDTLLKSASTLTLFAPSNTAFAAININAASIDTMSAATLQTLVSRHILATALLPSRIPDTITIASINFYNLHITNNANGFFVNGTPINNTRPAANGLLQPIGSVLTVPTQTIGDYLRSDTSFSGILKIYNAVSITHLLDSNRGTYTLLAPRNSALGVAGYNTDTFSIQTDSLVGGRHLLSLMCLACDFINNGTFRVNNTLIPSAYYASPYVYDTLSTFVNGASYMVRRYRDSAVAASALQQQDILCINGVVHVIDRALK